ncbi:MAG: choice-of-anchor D domain-containing protein [Myxococcales bacterium]|nr:choice-of-anchor D domain-containing protein [Myxococcales bacterium]
MKRKLLFTSALLLVACDRGAGTGPSIILEPPPNGIEAEPKWLTFTCVEPGCDTTLEASIAVVGDRAVAIKRIVLSDRERTDFQIETTRTPPFVLEPREAFTIEAKFAPDGDPRLGDVDIRVTYGDASAEETEDRIEPGELTVPLVRRLIGEPKLVASPAALMFGPVLPSAEKRLPLTITNEGFGNVGLVLQSVESDHPGIVRVDNLPPNALVPGDSWDLEVVYTPNSEDVLDGVLKVVPVGTTVAPVEIPYRGTSVPRPRLVTDPEAVALGEIPVGMMRLVDVELSNLGAEPLFVSNIQLGRIPGNATVQMRLDGSETLTATIAPLATKVLSMAVLAEDAGEIDTHLRITSTDPASPVRDLPFTGLVTKPQVQVNPGALDFGNVPRGWTLVQNVEVSNAGYGDLVITNVSMILGSSDLFTLREVPNLPITLRHDQRVGFEIEFRSEAEASFSATLSVDTNDPETPFVEIPLGATGASCDLGCPIQNGTPRCTGGVCEVGSCNADWYDTDNDPATGCECAEIDRDPGSFCAQARYLGQIEDEDGDRSTFTGILPTAEDEDIIRFFGYDATGFLSDAYDVRITLESTDPNIKLCVYRHDTGSHATECYFDNESCPSNRSYRKDGSFGRDDSADYVIKVYRENGTAPTCTPYTLFIRNG